MTRLNWPTAFALVFGGIPALLILLAVLATYPAVGWPFVIGAGLFISAERIGRRRALIAERAALSYAQASAIVAAPLPEPRTIPLPTRRAQTLRR